MTYCRLCGEPIALDDYQRKFWVSLYGGMRCCGTQDYHEPGPR